MGKPLIMVSSVTYAIKGRDLLRKMGYSADIERTPGTMDRVGCGYSITTELDGEAARAILEENNIKVGGISAGEAS